RVTPVQIRPKRKGIEPDRPAAGPEATAAGGVSGPEHATTRWKLGREETMLTRFKSRRPGPFPMKPFGKNVEGLFSLDCGGWSRVGTGTIDSAVCERIVRPSSHFPFASDLLRFKNPITFGAQFAVLSLVARDAAAVIASAKSLTRAGGITCP